MQTLALRISAILGFAAVALGAFGAHGLKELLARHDAAATWQTAALYHLVHAVALLVLATGARWRPGPWCCFVAGILLFSGSLYLLAVSGLRWIGAITPVGGLAFLAGWIWLAASLPEPRSTRQ